MPYRKKDLDLYYFYHIYNRGVNKEKIFYSADNYLYLIKLLNKYLKNYHTTMVAYCLMPNHYHFLIRQNIENNLSDFMKGLFGAYVQGLNKKINRRGPLFEGRFKHIKIERHEHLLHLCRYIHLNPVKDGLVSYPEEWPYSNYLDWIGKRNRKLWDPEFVFTYFNTQKEYVKFVSDYKDELEYQRTVKAYLFG